MPNQKPKLTIKQAKFVKGIAEGKPDYIAALEAYDIKNPDNSTARSMANENRTKPNVQEAIGAAMAKLNLTPERALQPIDDALNDDDVKTRLMGSDRALRLMGITNKQDGATQNFIQIVNEQKNNYGI